ncbi:MAG: hypothetical protein AAF637_07795 [Pseudomonadota bacterium]
MVTAALLSGSGALTGLGSELGAARAIGAAGGGAAAGAGGGASVGAGIGVTVTGVREITGALLVGAASGDHVGATATLVGCCLLAHGTWLPPSSGL